MIRAKGPVEAAEPNEACRRVVISDGASDLRRSLRQLSNGSRTRQ